MVKNILKSGFGGVVSQVINFIALPFISRLYAPETYASWAIIMATTSIFSSIACFRYELAVVIPEDDGEASPFFWWCVFSSMGMGMIAAVSINVPWLKDILSTNNSQTHGLNSIVIPLLITTTGMTVLMQYWNIRHQSFFWNSFSQIALVSVTITIQISYALMIADAPQGLIIGSLFGQIAAFLISFIGSAYNKKYPKISVSILKKIPVSLKRQRPFFFFSTPYTLFGLIRERASVFVLEYFLGHRDVGMYAFAYRILYFPVNLVSNSLRPVLFHETAFKGVRVLEKQINGILKWLAMIVIPFVVLYLFYARTIFRWFFGERWSDAGFMGIFIIFPVATFLFCNWMDRIMDVLGKQKLTLFLEIIFASMSIIGLWLGFRLNLGMIGALFIQSIVLVIYNITYLYIVYDKAGLDKLGLYNLLYRSLIWSSLCTVILFVLNKYTLDIWAIHLYSIVVLVILSWYGKSQYKRAEESVEELQ